LDVHEFGAGFEEPVAMAEISYRDRRIWAWTPSRFCRRAITSKRLRACGLPLGPSIRIRLLGGRPVSSPSLEADRGVDVIAQHGLAGLGIARQKAFQGLGQQRAAEGLVGLRPRLDGIFEK